MYTVFMDRAYRFIGRGRISPNTLSLVFLFVMYVDLFLMSAGLFIIAPGHEHATLSALLIPLVLTLAACVIIFKQLPPLKKVHFNLYRFGLVFPSLSLISLLAYVDWTISRMNPANFHGLHTKWDAVHFTITTMTTVGYGDIYPASQLARFWTDVQIVLGVAFIGFVIQRELMAARSGDPDKISADKMSDKDR